MYTVWKWYIFKWYTYNFLLKQQLKMLEVALVTDLDSMGQVGFHWFLMLLEHVPLSNSLWSVQYCLKSCSLTQPFLTASIAVLFHCSGWQSGQFPWLWEVWLTWGALSFSSSLLQSAQEHELPKPDKAGISTLPPSFTCPALWDILASSRNKLKEQFISVSELYVWAVLLVSQVRAEFLCKTITNMLTTRYAKQLTALPARVDNCFFHANL